MNLKTFLGPLGVPGPHFDNHCIRKGETNIKRMEKRKETKDKIVHTIRQNKEIQLN